MEILNEQSSNKTSFWCVCSLVFCRLSLHSTVRANKSNDLNPKGALALKHRWQHENNVHKKCGSLVVAAVFVCVLTIRFLSEREISNEAWEKPTVNLSRAILFQIVFTYNRNAQNPFVIFEKAFHFGMIMRPPTLTYRYRKWWIHQKYRVRLIVLMSVFVIRFPKHIVLCSLFWQNVLLRFEFLTSFYILYHPNTQQKFPILLGGTSRHLLALTLAHTQTRWNDIILLPLMHDFLNSLAWYFHLSHKKMLEIIRFGRVLIEFRTNDKTKTCFYRNVFFLEQEHLSCDYSHAFHEYVYLMISCNRPEYVLLLNELSTTSLSILKLELIINATPLYASL